MVTGSHHPQGYLCLKLRMEDGSTANQDVIEELEESMASEPMGIEEGYRTADIIPDVYAGGGIRLSMPRPFEPLTCVW